MERSQVNRERGKSRKSIRDVIKKDLEVNDLEKYSSKYNIIVEIDPCSRPHLVR